MEKMETMQAERRNSSSRRPAPSRCWAHFGASSPPSRWERSRPPESPTAQIISTGAPRSRSQVWRFKNQYRMTVAGNLVTPNNLDRTGQAAGHHRRPPDGRGEGAKFDAVCAPKLAEQGFVTLAIRPAVLGRKRGPAAQPRGARHCMRKTFSAAVDYLGTPSFHRPRSYRRIGICGSGSFVISAAKYLPTHESIATVSMYDMGAVSRDALKHSLTLAQRKPFIAEGWSNAIASSPAASRIHRGTDHAAQRQKRTPFSANSMLFTAPHAAYTCLRRFAGIYDAADAEQQGPLHEFLSLQRHRHDCAAPPAVHRR